MSIVLFENKKDCCGCWGCYNICPKSAITMEIDNEGFKYPIVNDGLCIECGMCQRACPIKKANKRINYQKSIPRIGIINLQFTNNYGASIAASVLETVVSNIVGNRYIVETINYQGQVNGGIFERYKDQINDAGGYLKYRKRKKSYSASVGNAEMRSVRSNRFLVYNDTFLNITPKIGNVSEINNKNYVAFIAGSDVIWQPKRTTNFRSDGYYLKFANENQRKIAYAPSIDHICDKRLVKLSSVYKEKISKLDYISVRESSSVDFLQHLTDKRVYNCCDPALLVDKEFYMPMIEKAEVEKTDKQFIYVYILDEESQIVEYARKLATEKGLKIYYYCPNELDFGIDAEYCLADGPCEFLSRLYSANYVLTNSFHCVVFSLLFQKKFLSFKRNSESIKSTDLLNLFDLEDRLIMDNQDFSIDNEIDFEKTSIILDKIRKKSNEYLEMALLDLG